MTELWIVSILFIFFGSWLIVALVSYFLKELRPIPHRSEHVSRVELTELPGVSPTKRKLEKKDSFEANRVNIPPSLDISHQEYSPTSLSGMGGSWKPLRGVMPKRMRRFPHNLQQP